MGYSLQALVGKAEDLKSISDSYDTAIFKSLKQNVSIAKSPTRTLITQSNHLFASILAYVKLEKLKFANKMNHFALKTKIYNAALKAAFKELTIFKNNACA